MFEALSLHSPVASLEDVGQYSELKVTGAGSIGFLELNRLWITIFEPNKRIVQREYYHKLAK